MSAGVTPRRVLLTTDAVGGVWTYTMTLAAGLAADGVDCCIATLGPPPDAGQRAAARQAGATLCVTDLALEWTAAVPGDVDAAAGALAWLARQQGADLVHLHTPALAISKYDMPVVAVVHSCIGTWWRAVHGAALPHDLQWRARQLRHGLAAAAAVIVPSAAFGDLLRDAYGDDIAVTVVHNGCEPAFEPTSGPAPERGRTVLCAGRLWDAGKNIAMLDAIAASSPIRFEAAGPASFPTTGPFRPHHLTLLGTLDAAALVACCRRCALFAAPSLYEPFGLAVLEAASVGAPLLLADIPTFRELWDGAAVFAPPRDAAAWSCAVTALMASPGRRAALGEAASKRALRYGRAAMVARTGAVHRHAHARALAA